MGYMMQGTLYIPTVDFWGFVQNYYLNAFGSHALDDDGIFFSNDIRFEGDQLVIPYENGHGDLFMDGADFWEFVMKYTPCNVAEYAFGVPKIDDYDLTLTFAANTETHPVDQSVKPDCLKEWD